MSNVLFTPFVVVAVASLAHLKIQRDNELSEETYRHWKEISTKRHRFHSRFASARSLADISQDEVIIAPLMVYHHCWLPFSTWIFCCFHL